MSTELTLGLQPALPFCVLGPGFPWGWRDGGGEEQDQEKVGVEACLGPLHMLQ